MKIGYARVSTADQKLDMQIEALQNAGCEKIYKETASGAQTRRVELEKALDDLRPGDTLVVWRLDRLARSIRDLIHLGNQLKERDIELCSLHENIDTTTATGQFCFHMFGAMAEFERNLIKERTEKGRRVARAQGKRGGRPPALSEKNKKKLRKVYQTRKDMTVSDICRMFGVSRPTLYSYIKN